MMNIKETDAKNILMYGHYGSSNRGCEAIVRGTAALLKDADNNINIKLVSNNPQSDIEAMESRCPVVVRATGTRKGSLKDYIIWVLKRLRLPNTLIKWIKFGGNNRYIRWSDTGLSIGGDTYCYKTLESFFYFNKRLNKLGKKNILWGCSIEPTDINWNEAIRANLKLFDAIFARESITYNALVESKINDNVFFCPDPAFLLEPESVPLPSGWDKSKVVGINLSRMIVGTPGEKNLVMKSIRWLVRYILDNTVYSVMLIPHVIAKANDDLECLRTLKDFFPDEDRVMMTEESYNSPQTKYIISNCDLFIGARTHSVIAAYSSCVPALALGYSVKARGIAKDIFNDWKGMVILKDSIAEPEDLIEPFRELLSNKDKIKEHLCNIMPEYKKQIDEAAKVLVKSINGFNNE